MRKLAILIGSSLLLSAMLEAQITVSPMVMPRKQFFDASGRPLAGGHVCTYTVGTSTPQVTFTDYTGGTPNPICDPLTDPPHSDGIVLDAGGYASIYVNCTLSPLKVVTYDQNLVLQWSEDGVSYPTCIQPQACPAGQFVTGWNGLGVPICSTPPGGGSLTCDPTSIVDIYVDIGGSDVTGDGSIGSPYATIQHAIDTDVPIFVGKKYYIHLVSAGSYDGFTYEARSDCSDGLACGNSAPDYLTPFGTGLSVIGSTDGINSDSWIITSAIVVDGLKLYLQGMEISNGATGVAARNHAQLALGAVHSHNNNLGFLGTFFSKIYLIPGIYVENDFATALATASGGFDPSADGFEVTEDSVLTDSCPDGDNAPLGTTLACSTATASGFGIACVEGKKAQLYMRDDVLVDWSASSGGQGDGLQILDSHFALARYTFTSLGTTSGGAGVDIQGGRLSGGALGGGVYNITGGRYGVLMAEGGEVTDVPTIASSATSDYQAAQQSLKGETNLIGGSGGNIYVVTFSATPTFSVANGYVQKITLTSNVTSSTFSNGYDGAILTMQICQNAGGGNTFAWPADVLGADTIGGTASKCNVQRFVYDATAAKWYALAAMVKNM